MLDSDPDLGQRGTTDDSSRASALTKSTEQMGRQRARSEYHEDSHQEQMRFVATEKAQQIRPESIEGRALVLTAKNAILWF
jgi:hypothetical protein